MRDHEAIRQAIAAYALDALEADERAAVEHELVGHLPGCEECSAMLRDFREVGGELALAAPPRRVSDDAERRLFAATRADHERLPAPRRHTGRLVRIGAISALVALAASVSINGVLASRVRRSDASAARLTEAVAVLGDPHARSVPLRGREGSMLLVYRRNAKAVLVGSAVASPPRGLVFELWVLRAGRTFPVSVFTPRDGRVVVPVRLDLSTANGLAVTIEKRFVRAPTSAPVYAGSLEA